MGSQPKGHDFIRSSRNGSPRSKSQNIHQPLRGIVRPLPDGGREPSDRGTPAVGHASTPAVPELLATKPGELYSGTEQNWPGLVKRKYVIRLLHDAFSTRSFAGLPIGSQAFIPCRARTCRAHSFICEEYSPSLRMQAAPSLLWQAVSEAAEPRATATGRKTSGESTTSTQSSTAHRTTLRVRRSKLDWTRLLES